MKAFSLIPVLLLGVCAAMHAEEPKPESTLKTPKEKIGYAIGVDIGTNLKHLVEEIDVNALTTGFKDSITAGKMQMTQPEMQEVLTGLQASMQKKMAEKAKNAGETNLKAGEAFLAENKKKEGVTELPSGLQYKVIKEGAGEMPKATDTVSTHYKGTLIDGTEFDSSYKRGQPATFPVGGVIAGWTEALKLMKVGSKWQLFIPSKLGYKEQGAGEKIGPNAVLIFDIELISIGEPKAAPAPTK